MTSRAESPAAARARGIRPLALVLSLVLGMGGLCPATLAQEIIGHAGLRVTELSRNQARLFFTMRLAQLPDNTQVRIFVLPDDHPLHARFAKAVLGLFPYQLRQVWDRQVYSGTGQAPTTVGSEQDMIARVAATPGAIGYVERLPDHAGIRPLPVR